MSNSHVAEVYRRFAVREAHGESSVYEEWALCVADDPEMLARIGSLPARMRQPNLLFAAARFLGAPEDTWAALRPWLLDAWERVRGTVLTRSTQTNEAARCAVLLPVLSRLDGPLALLEVGASAGLCLYPDHYSYRYEVADHGTVALDPSGGPSAVRIPCRIDRSSVPERLPEVAWRAGVDLDPIDPADPDGRRWLRTLVWPGQDDRRRRLDAALDIAAAERAPILQGDLVEATTRMIDAVPAGMHVVVFYSSVLVYVDGARRERFVDEMRALEHVTWISNEGEHVLGRVAERLPRPSDGRTVLSVDEVPVAFVGPHGQSYEAIGP